MECAPSTTYAECVARYQDTLDNPATGHIDLVIIVLAGVLVIDALWQWMRG